MNGIDFFLSTITATISMPSKDVNPALAFWVVINPSYLQECTVYQQMRSNTFGAELKIMTNKTAKNEVERQSCHVSMALKDYGHGYVRSMLDFLLPAEYKPCQYGRVYIRAGMKYTNDVLNARHTLERHGVELNIETF